MFVVSGGNDEVYGLKFSATADQISDYYLIDTLTHGKAMVLKAGWIDGKPILFAVSGATTYRPNERQELEIVISNGDRNLYAMRFDEQGNPLSEYYRLGDGTVVGMDNNFAQAIAIGIALGYRAGILYAGYHAYEAIKNLLRECNEFGKERLDRPTLPKRECYDDNVCRLNRPT